MTDIKDGNYTVEAELKGGTGRVSVSTPVPVKVEEGKITANIEWSSPNYDYMEVEGKGYEPVNEEGNSLFVVEIPDFDMDIPVKAETVAMSEPHMIEYSIYFDSSTLKTKGNIMPAIIFAVIFVAVITGVVFIWRKKNEKK